MSARYAVYFAPAADSPWWAFGCQWLGRDARATPADAAHAESRRICPGWAGLSAPDWEEATQAPARYGFHATLKAPFRLAADANLAVLQLRLADLAARQCPLALNPMQAVVLGDFVALVPTQTTPALVALAAACVTELDDLRAPITPAERARRRADQLPARAAELLERWGYPHVLERFQLHFSLTGPVDGRTAQQVCDWARAPLAQLNAQQPLWLDRLCLFVQAQPGAAFACVGEWLLTGG
jgi:putative phosphonate metabolism protein